MTEFVDVSVGVVVVVVVVVVAMVSTTFSGTSVPTGTCTSA